MSDQQSPQTGHPPALSVAIAIDRERDRAAIALESVLSQSIISRLEVLILDAGHARFSPIRGAAHPAVRVLPVTDGAGYGDALTLGVRQARAPIVAFLEEHVQVFPGWAEAIVAAHEGLWAAVGGEVHPGHLDRLAARVVELVSRHNWSAPAQRGEAIVLRWQNVSYKRDQLLRYGDRLPLLLQAEGTLFMQLRADGERLFIEPAAKLIHAHELSWSVFLSGSFLSSRMATACAVKLSGEEGMRKLAGALLGPVRWPLVLLRRTRSLPDRATWERRFWLYLPFVLLYYSTVAVGTLCGLAFGIGGSDRQFFNAEANSVRKVPAPPGRAKA